MLYIMFLSTFMRWVGSTVGLLGEAQKLLRASPVSAGVEALYEVAPTLSSFEPWVMIYRLVQRSIDVEEAFIL